MVGDTIGEIGRPEPSSPSLSYEGIREIVSPTDGFLIYELSDGKPMIAPDTVLHPGMAVAVIEMMKIRMDVLFDGPDGARFVN